ncbi:PilN domain-containing protein [Clostridium niameyense]|uniref:PilN domain-containing protein n=1 Tax=Clostridium niameyense TaxID=1622073 RepID=A0A6M0RBJ5_9CLOT|nr:PilN domain-containing protein [Clostridium niameyense]NEZ46558.1 PilN domain-containing protein [Clostridium niameyense]
MSDLKFILNKNNKSQDFNFFKNYIGKEKQEKRNTNVIISSISILILIFIGSYFLNFIHIKNLENEIGNLEKFVNSPASKLKISTMETLEKKEKILDEYYASVKKINTNVEKRDIVNSKLLEQISKVVPGNVSFKLTSISSDGIQIQGVSENRQSIAEIQHNLKALNFIEDVQVSNINENLDENTSKNYSFSLKCTLKDVDDDEGN